MVPQILYYKLDGQQKYGMYFYPPVAAKLDRLRNIFYQIVCSKQNTFVFIKLFVQKSYQ